jgi:VIT1/CCC1 family predicted Fe2+/Mn2+ transporter
MDGSSAWRRFKASFETSAGDVVFGMEDGTVSIFGLVFGVAATTTDTPTVLIAGASGAVAAAVSMMAGTYLDVETSLDAARASAAKIETAIEHDPESVLDGVLTRLRASGLEPEQAQAVTRLFNAEPTLLKPFALSFSSSGDGSLAQSPLVHALWMLVADFLAAAIPIIPFAVLPVAQGRVVSGTVTLLLLVGLGVGRARIGHREVLRTMLETVAIGVAAAAAGVAIGIMISRIFGG